MPDQECDGRGTGRPSRPVASLYVTAEMFARLEASERIPCGRGMKGRRNAGTFAERYEETMTIRYETENGVEYAAADRAAIARVTGRKL
ncbi:MAG: hypothetical protein IVW54_16900 [Candidatus Binataceae bacterium]|nr:hypothetical protein [Candidatus Binataceae bacterium]